MGSLRKIKRNLNRQKLMAHTGLLFNDKPILIGIDNPLEAKEVAREFQLFMAFMHNRISLGDVYRAHFKILARMKAGEGLLN